MPVEATLRGEIWLVKLPTDPSDQAPRPVVIASTNARNVHPRADTVLVIPFFYFNSKRCTHSSISVSGRNRLGGFGSEGGGRNRGPKGELVKTTHRTPQSEYELVPRKLKLPWAVDWESHPKAR